MKHNLKNAAFAVALAALAGTATVTVAMPAMAQAPQLTMKSEEAAHPQLVKAIHEMRGALKELEAAPHDFGGNKKAAMEDTKKAIHSLKKALYYRLKLDDAALDRAE